MKKSIVLTMVLIISICPFSTYTASTSSDGLPSNVALAQEFVPTTNILKNLQDMFNFFTPAKGTGSQLEGVTEQFKNKILTSLRKLLAAIQTPDFTAYLKERDKVRNSSLSPQARTGGFANAYSNNAAIVDQVNQRYQEIITAITSIATAETAVVAIGENSEVKLRDRLVPFLNVALKIFQ